MAEDGLFDDGPLPPAGEPVRLSALVTAVRAPNPGAFTFTGTQTYVISAGSAAMVIDPGPEDPRHLEAVLNALQGRSVSHILVTHTHRDHSPLAARLAALTGAPVLAYGPHGAGRRPFDPALEPILESFAGLEAGADTTFAPDERLQDGATVAGAGFVIEAWHTPGHAANHLCFYLAEERILFTGDHVMGWSTTVIAPPDGDMRAYLESLERLAGDERPRVYLPTHGPAIRRPQRHLRRLIAHRRMRERMILKALAQGARDLDAVVAAAYPGLNPGLRRAAAASALAHLIALAQAGRVALSAQEDGRIRISAIGEYIGGEETADPASAEEGRRGVGDGDE